MMLKETVFVFLSPCGSSKIQRLSVLGLIYYCLSSQVKAVSNFLFFRVDDLMDVKVKRQLSIRRREEKIMTLESRLSLHCCSI